MRITTDRSAVMRALSLEFAGYASGETDFATRYATFPPGSPPRSDLDASITRIASIVDGAGTAFVAISVVGFSDRNDTAGLSAAAARASETQASTDRATSAWAWMQDAVTAALATPLVDWWDASPNVTWMVVPTGAAILAFPTPADAAERLANRRVKIVLSFFG